MPTAPRLNPQLVARTEPAISPGRGEGGEGDSHTIKNKNPIKRETKPNVVQALFTSEEHLRIFLKASAASFNEVAQRPTKIENKIIVRVINFVEERMRQLEEEFS